MNSQTFWDVCYCKPSHAYYFHRVFMKMVLWICVTCSEGLFICNDQLLWPVNLVFLLFLFRIPGFIDIHKMKYQYIFCSIYMIYPCSITCFWKYCFILLAIAVILICLYNNFFALAKQICKIRKFIWNHQQVNPRKHFSEHNYSIMECLLWQ